MAALNSFCELPRRDDLQQFEPARKAHLTEKPSVIRESRSSAVLQALMDMQDQIRRLQSEKTSLNRQFQELSEEAARYKADLNCRDHSRPGKSSVVRELENARNQLWKARVPASGSFSTLSSITSSPSRSYWRPVSRSTSRLQWRTFVC